MASILSYIKGLFSDSPKVKNVDGLEGMAKVDALLYNLFIEKQVPGLAVTILKDGKTIYRKGYGYADITSKTPVNPQKTIFRIASISKCISGIALGKMMEEGIVDLDAPFHEYVPYYPKKKYDFTLRQLAAHTAGIRAYRGKEYALNEPYSIKEGIQVFENDPLVFEPGKDYLYNSFDFVLLSLAMQEASGIPFQEYVKEKILEPLRMVNTFEPCQVERSRDLRQGSVINEVSTALDLTSSEYPVKYYTKIASGFREAVPVNNFYKLAGGGYLSTSDDIAKLGQAILEGRLLKAETYNEILTQQFANGKPTHYGLGFQVSQDAQGRNFIGHIGNNVGAYSNFFVYPDEQLAVSILVNCTDPKIQETLDTVIQSV